jgi:ADP-ribosyl-[dinitrogen reductase] hydrolase
MRMAPVALATYRTPERAEAWTLAQAHTTHNHPLSDAACLALVDMTHDLLRGDGREAARRRAEALVAARRQFRFAPYPGRASGFIVDTMQTALHGYFGADGFEDCVVATVNQGDDADTTGAIAGMLAGATYGVEAIPARWLDALDPPTAAAIRDQALRLLAMA